MESTRDSADAVAPKSLFISHSSKDSELAMQLCNALEARGVRCRIAPRDFELGAGYSEQIVRGIVECTSFLLLASKEAMLSDPVRNELEQASKYHKPIYTVMIDKSNVPRAVDYYIARLQWVEMGSKPVDEVARTVVQVLNKRSEAETQEEWGRVSAPPSLRRYVRYHREIFFQSLGGTLAALLLCGALIGYGLHQARERLESDYRSLGWVTAALEPQAAADGSLRLQGQLWLADSGSERGKPNLQLAWRDEQGRAGVEDVSAQLGGSPAMLQLSLPAGTTTLESCLALAGAHHPMRVAQRFAVVRGISGFELQKRGEAQVSKENGEPCGKGL
jgi:hypothetical protein